MTYALFYEELPDKAAHPLTGDGSSLPAWFGLLAMAAVLMGMKHVRARRNAA